MPKHVLVVKAAGVPAAIRQLKQQHQAERGRHQDVERYLRDHKPVVAGLVAQCRTKARVARDITNPQRRQVRLYGCHIYPWCFSCVREEHHKRAQKVLAKFDRCRPAGQEPRYAHVVHSAQLREDGTGWGHQAVRRVADFQDVMWRAVRDAFGKGSGGYVSYQAFGERAFGKLHPHVDLTVNGWRLDDHGNVEKTPAYDLVGGGHARWMTNIQNHVGGRFLIEPTTVKTNLNVQPFVAGRRAYYAAVLYQTRELVDVRKMTYDRQHQLVYWANYRENIRERMTVPEFKQGLADYQVAVGEWGKHQTRRIHKPYGHMADGVIGDTQAVMGGEVQTHRKGCPCGNCNEWEVMFDDVAEDFDPWQGAAVLA